MVEYTDRADRRPPGTDADRLVGAVSAAARIADGARAGRAARLELVHAAKPCGSRGCACRAASGRRTGGSATLEQAQTPSHESLQGYDYVQLTAADGGRLKSERSRQIVAGVERTLPGDFALRIEAYGRRFDRLLVQRLETDAERALRLSRYQIPSDLPADSVVLRTSPDGRRGQHRSRIEQGRRGAARTHGRCGERIRLLQLQPVHARDVRQHVPVRLRPPAFGEGGAVRAALAPRPRGGDLAARVGRAGDADHEESTTASLSTAASTDRASEAEAGRQLLDDGESGRCGACRCATRSG